MKTFLLCALCVFSAHSAFSQASIGGGGFGDAFTSREDGYYNTMCVHPFRKLGEKYCDLRPLFKWIEKGVNYRYSTKSPMPAWQPMHFRVRQIFKGGVLCSWGYSDDSTRYFLRNHPRQDKLVDGDHTYVLCVKLPERFQYTTVERSTATVDQYDYGQIFDPQQRAREVAAQKAAEKK